MVSHMFDMSINQMKKQSDQLFGNIEGQLVQKILAENVHAIEHIDNYIQQQENMLVDDFNEDQDIFERSEALKSLVEQTEKEYLPENLKVKIYGGEGVVEKNEDFEKSKKQQILARIERRERKERERQQNLQQNYMEKLRQNRELITAGTMVTQESGEGDFRPRQLKSTFAQQLKDESNAKKDNQTNQFRLSKYSDSETYKQSPNNPLNMKGSVVAFLAKDVLEKFYEEQEKKKKRDDEQQSRLKKQKLMQQSQQPSALSQQSTAPANTAVNSKSMVLQSIVSGDHSYIEAHLHDGLVDYINKADHTLVAIKDEDIALEEPGKKRRYRLKKKKVGSQDNTLGGSE